MKADPAVPAGSASPLSARRPLGDRTFQILALGSGLLVLVILVVTIGLVGEVPQPVTVSPRLRNIPQRDYYNWEPGAYFGIYRPDTFWFADKP